MRATIQRVVHRTQARIRRSYEGHRTAGLGLADKLIADGIVIIPSLFQDHQLMRARWQFERHIAGVVPDEHGKAAFHREHVGDFAEMVQHPVLVDIAECYWGCEVVMHEFHGYRLMPKAPDWTGAEQWHVEGRGKELRAMILLTDVGPEDQCLEVVPYTHTIWREAGENVDGVEALWRKALNGIVRGCGLAGSVILWDSNGIHRSTRSAGGDVRDVLLPRYVGDSPLRWLTGGPRRGALL